MAAPHLNVEIISWPDIRSKVSSLHPELTNLIDSLSPKAQKFKLYKVKYEFGDNVLRRGVLQLPTKDGDLVSLAHPDVPNSIREDLGYNSLTCPVMLCLQNHMELFLTVNNKVVPFLLVRPGGMFGVWRVLDNLYGESAKNSSYTIWDMTAGARSLFVLPKISEAVGHLRLEKTYGISADKPKGYHDHWNIFNKLYKSPAFDERWEVEIIFFSKEWFEHINDPEWKDLKLFLFATNWEYPGFWRNQYGWRMVLSRIQNILDVSHNPYHTDTVNQLLTIGMGALPAFEPAMNDNYGPINKLQTIYKNEYGLKWPPIMMQPTFFDMHSNEHGVYYSLQLPTAIDLAPKSSKRASVISDTYMVNSLVDKYMKVLMRDDFDIKDVPLTEISKHVMYTFHHTDISEYPRLHSTNTIFEEDPRFKNVSESFGYNEIPDSATFFKGCVRIAKKKA